MGEEDDQGVSLTDTSGLGPVVVGHQAAHLHSVLVTPWRLTHHPFALGGLQAPRGLLF
jgi:hypothetical protein